MASGSDRHRHRGLTLGLLTLLACPAQPAQSGPTEERASDPSELALARVDAGPPAMFGCAGLFLEEGLDQDLDQGPLRCLLRKPKPLAAWLEGRSDATIEVWFEGEALSSKLVRDRAGLLLEFEPPRARGRVELRAPTGEVWSVELAPTSTRYAELRKSANERGRAGDFEAAAAIFADAALELDPIEADLLRCDEARLAIADRRFEHVIATARGLADSPVISCAGAAHSLAAYVQLFEQPDFNAAEEQLEAAAKVGRFDFELAIGARYLRGVFDHRIGDIDESLIEFEASARLANLVGDDQQFMSSATMQAVALARLGRLREAEALADSIAARVDDLADAGRLIDDIRYDLAWIALLRREADRGAPDPSPTLRQLIADYTRSESLGDVARTRLHLVFARLQSRDFAGAQVEFDAIDPAWLDAHSLVWFELGGFELALANHQLRAARERLDRAELYADLTHDREHHFRVWAARGALARARGDRPGALAALRRASAIADELALAVPGSSGRSMLVTAHRQADAELVDLLVELDQPEAAFCAAVGIRARHLRALWARLRPPLSGPDQHEYQALLSQHRALRIGIDDRLAAAWQLPAPELQALRDELADQGEAADELLRRATALLERDAPRWSCDRVLPEREGDAILAMAPSANEGRWWFMLARRARGSTPGAKLRATLVEVVEVVDIAAPDDRAKQAITELEPELAEVARLDVIPVGELLSVDFHALVRPRAIAVAYSLGLGRIEARASEGVRASVVAGSSDLPAVVDEAEGITTRLATLGWEVAASWDPLSDDQPQLLHYAGHGHHAGEGGWDSYVEIPGFGRLSATQIVAGQRAPNIVVLGACSSGALNEQIVDGGMNLSAAFLLAGAELVIAPTGPVDDQTALRLSEALYGTLRAGALREQDASPTFIRALDLAQATPLGEAEPSGPRSFSRWRAWRP